MLTVVQYLLVNCHTVPAEETVANVGLQLTIFKVGGQMQ